MTAVPLHLRDEQFQTVSSVKGLPLGVRGELQTMFGSTDLDIAEPHAEFDSGGKAATPGLPLRRLIAAGCATDNHCLVYYERGGDPRAHRVALIHWTPTQTRFEWGGTAPGGFASIDDVRKAIVSGDITGKQDGPW
jgi:hypothetical protein